MFWRKQKFEPEGSYDGYGYKVVEDGKVDVRVAERIVRFDSVEDMIARLDRFSARRASEMAGPPETPTPPSVPSPQPPDVPTKKKRSGCGCLVLILIPLAAFYFFAGGSGDKAAEIINSQFGQVCEAKAEGLFSDTLRLDWTARTTKLHTITVMAAIGSAKETLYSKGIRYLKFPNDAGGYNVIDWKTGEKTSTNERAPYYFSR